MKSLGVVWKFLIFSLLVLNFSSCKKDVFVPENGTLTLNVEYRVEDKLVQFDTLLYTNQAGNKYSLNHLEYYISNIVLYKEDGSSFKSTDVFYINAKRTSTNKLTLNNIPPGTYTSVSLLIGLDSNQNKTNALPNTVDNVNMAWPVAMGGGYHFMKMEGYFLDKDGISQNGYAMHLGKNPHLVKVDILKSLSIASGEQFKTLSMEINQWYKEPAVYDFETDGNYSMGSSVAMLKLANNGKDVFILKD